MKISKTEVEHVAQLAKLTLTESELDMMTGQLDNILSYVDKLASLDTTGISATFHVFSVTNAFREDIVQQSLPRDEALMNASQHKNGMFQVPKII